MGQNIFLESKKPENLMNTAYGVLKSSICNNSIKQGSLLSETQIATELGMSRTPVREALKVLAIEGFVEIRTGIGAYVKTISYKEFVDIYEVRKSLEVLAAKTAINNITNKEVVALEEKFNALLRKHNNNIDIGIDEFTYIDLRLHELIVEKSDNQYVKTIMDKIIDNVKRVQTMSFQALNDLEESTKQHLHLLELIEQKDYDKLSKAIEEHIDWSIDCLKMF